jgi:hypothetical protein
MSGINQLLYLDATPRRSISTLDSIGWRFRVIQRPRVQSPVEAGMTHQFDVVIEKDSEGYLVATVPALPGNLTIVATGARSSFAESQEEPMSINCHSSVSRGTRAVQRPR